MEVAQYMERGRPPRRRLTRLRAETEVGRGASGGLTRLHQSRDSALPVALPSSFASCDCRL